MTAIDKAITRFPDLAELRAGTLIVLDAVGDGLWAWKPPGGAHSIAGWVRHLAQTEDFFVRSLILGQQMLPKRKADLPNRAAITAYLQETRDYTIQVLQEMDAERLHAARQLPDGFRGRPPAGQPTVRWFFQALLYHEVHHRAQIQLYQRLAGRVPPVV